MTNTLIILTAILMVLLALPLLIKVILIFGAWWAEQLLDVLDELNILNRKDKGNGNQTNR